MCMPDKIDFKTNTGTKDKEGHHNDKGSVHQEDMFLNQTYLN